MCQQIIVVVLGAKAELAPVDIEDKFHAKYIEKLKEYVKKVTYFLGEN